MSIFFCTFAAQIMSMEKLLNIVRFFLRLVGYYAVKAKWRKSREMSRWKKEDIQRMKSIFAEINLLSGWVLPKQEDGCSLTVSLTSHGSRVSKYVTCAIFSILQQSKLPNRIVLNLDKNQWSESTLPTPIQQLQVAGLEVNFCEDVGPHTKFLPTLEKYPDDVIVTIDDDIFYGDNMLELLWNAYLNSDRKTVICHECKVIQKDENGRLLPYSQWTAYDASKDSSAQLSPYGYRGILYPPHIFSEEIFRVDVYGQLCPKADDIWFTMMELRDGISVDCVGQDRNSYYDVDRCNEFEQNGSDALHFQNGAQGQNDVQLAALKKYYGI